jgi:hypothetical protein
MQHYDDEAGDSVAMIASPDAKPQAAGAAPPKMGGGASDRPQNAAKAMLGRAFIPNSDGQQGGMFGGMKKKVFSMADLAGAVSNAGSMSPFGAISRPKKPPAPVAAADDDDIGVDSDAEGDEDDEMQGELLSHTAGGLALHEKPKGGMFRVQSKLEMGTQFSPIYAVRKSVSEKKVATRARLPLAKQNDAPTDRLPLCALCRRLRTSCWSSSTWTTQWWAISSPYRTATTSRPTCPGRTGQRCVRPASERQMRGAARETCPVSTEGGTRRVQLVREGGGCEA